MVTEIHVDDVRSAPQANLQGEHIYLFGQNCGVLTQMQAVSLGAQTGAGRMIGFGVENSEEAIVSANSRIVFMDAAYTRNGRK